ncbi:hypothetical protein FBY34_8587 [Streptomyces sp. SLBN-115]|nr:hypothetical protein FBY34_8587 [Streptomyces sp. SLBN-115]
MAAGAGACIVIAACTAVCAGQITLAAAQQAIDTDWTPALTRVCQTSGVTGVVEGY